MTSTSNPSTNSNSSTTPNSKGKGKDLRLPKFTPVTSTQLDQEQPTSGLTTPNIAETASQIRRSLSVSGLSELAHLPPGQLRKNVGKKIWRPQDEEARIPGDWERLMVHVVRAGIRAGTLAFGLRATVSLVFTLLKGLRTKKLKGRDVVEAIFGPTVLRFAAMFAAWATLYKATHNSLRLLTSTPQPRSFRSQSDPRGGSINMERLDSSSSSTSDDNHPASGSTTPPAISELSEEERAKHKADTKRKIFMGDPRSRVWHAYLAGAVSSLAILVERKQDRISLAQQLFVRGLEGTYNVAHSRGKINIPHGAVLTFGLACGQIMYAWLDAPESLPRGYLSWITKASQVSSPIPAIHRSIVLDKSPKASDALQYFTDGKVPTPSSSGRYPNVAPNAINRRGITGKNVGKIVQWMKDTEAGKVGLYAPHSMTHPWENSHFWSPLDRFVEVTRWILPVYMTLHFVPAVFLRMGSFLKSPLRVFLRSLFGSVRSSSFLGLFVAIFQTWYCLMHSLHERIVSSETLSSIFPEWFKKLLVSQGIHWFGGFLTSLSLFVEHPRRRAELAAYVLPKGMESAWSVARKRSWVPFVPGGDLLLTSLGMSLVMGTYAQSPEHLSGLVRRIVYQFVGRN